MAEERKIGVSFSFSKRKPAIKSYSSEKNALSIDEDKVKDDEKDYIHSAEEKELKRYISVACSPGGGGTPIWNRRECSSEILNLTPKGDQSGRGLTKFWPLKETAQKHTNTTCNEF